MGPRTTFADVAVAAAAAVVVVAFVAAVSALAARIFRLIAVGQELCPCVVACCFGLWLAA